jgi:symplekin
VSSVRKHLKLQLLNLLKYPSSIDYHSNITTLLTDLGATHQEVMKVYPKPEEIKKHKLKRQQTTAAADSSVLAKKPKLEIDLDEEEEEEIDEEVEESKNESAIDITERFVLERLGPEVACNLVMSAMVKLPEIMPPHFSATYTPIAAAGTKAQIKHLSRLIATQLTAANLGPGVKLAKKQVKPLTVEEPEEVVQKPSRTAITTIISGRLGCLLAHSSTFISTLSLVLLSHRSSRRTCSSTQTSTTHVTTDWCQVR